MLFYVMPFVAGETLRERLTRDTQLSIDEAVRISREVAEVASVDEMVSTLERSA